MASADSTTKRCSKCGEVKPATLDFFYWQTSRNNFHSWCKVCHKSINAANTAKWRKAHPEQQKQHVKNWRKNHPEVIRTIHSRSARKQYELHPEIALLSVHKRRLKEKDLPSNFTSEQWQQTLEYFHGKCAVCDHASKLQMDHWIPVNSPDCPGTIATNIICLCESCNRSKGDSLPDEWVIKKLGRNKGIEKLASIAAYFEWVKDIV